MQISLKYLFGEPECKNGPEAKMFCGLDISKPELDQNGTRTELDQNGTIPEQNWTRTELHQNGTKAERYQNSIVSERIYIRKGKQKKEKEKERKGRDRMGKDVIVACDFASAEATYAFLDKFEAEERKPFVKIGMELYYAEGPEIVRGIKARGHRIFLDLKLHDIPNTVKKAMAVLARLDVDVVNVHAAGTKAMMQGALEGLEQGTRERIEREAAGSSSGNAAEDAAESAASGNTKAPASIRRPLLIAVTQLTSTDQEALEKELLIERPMAEVVMDYARNAKAAGLDGVVCSPLEAAAVHKACGESFLTITPGIRFADGEVGDQKRVMTPAAAKEAGSDYIVVGRPITAAADPVAAYRRCCADFL